MTRAAQESLHVALGGREVEERVARVAEGADLDVLRVIRELEEEMREAAAALEYERAALLRDQIRELKAQSGIAPPAAPTDRSAPRKPRSRKPVGVRSGRERR